MSKLNKDAAENQLDLKNTSPSKSRKTVNVLLFEDYNELLDDALKEPLLGLSSIEENQNKHANVNKPYKNKKISDSHSKTSSNFKDECLLPNFHLSSKEENTFPQKSIANVKLNTNILVRSRHTPLKQTILHCNSAQKSSKKDIHAEENVLHFNGLNEENINKKCTSTTKLLESNVHSSSYNEYNCLPTAEKKENILSDKKVTGTKLDKQVLVRDKLTPVNKSIKKLNINLLPKKPNMDVIQEKFNENGSEKPFNDSFENDFTKLSEKTPIKSISENFIIPKMNKVAALRAQSTNVRNGKGTMPFKAMDHSKFHTPVQNNSASRPNIIYSSSKTDVRKLSSSKEEIKINGRPYLVLKLLGQGGSAKVFHCLDLTQKLNVAVKCVSFSMSMASDGILREVEVLRNLQKCNKIIKMYDYELQDNDKLFVVMELGTVDLSKILKDFAISPEPTPSYLILFYWMEMLHAVQEIHSYGIIHSDLKPANFLVVNGRLKLIDFGISCWIQNDMTSAFKNVAEGSINYVSPEALDSYDSKNVGSPNYGQRKYKLSYKSDVWSLGCILYQLVYKKTPFHHITVVLNKALAILNCDIHYPPDGHVSLKFVNTIKTCLVRDYKSRPSIEQLITEYEGLLEM